MTLVNPIQPRYKIIITGVKSNQKADLAPYTSYPVVYEETADLMSRLTFNVVKDGIYWLKEFRIGQLVEFYGDSYSDNTEPLMVFKGNVTRVSTTITPSGLVEFRVEALEFGYSKLGLAQRTFVYPDKSNGRPFAKKDSLTIEDIVRGIASEHNLEVDIDLSTDAGSVVFDKKKVRYQKDESDWMFLRKLANDNGCSFSLQEGKLLFKSISSIQKNVGGIQFVFPLKGVVGDIRQNEIQEVGDSEMFFRPRILRNLSITEDISQATAVKRTVLYYDKSTGQARDLTAVTSVDDKGKPVVTFYELDESKVRETMANRKEDAEFILNNPGHMMAEWGDPKDPRSTAYYYKEVKIYDENVGTFDTAFFGIEVSATVNMDLDLKPQRYYKLRGIASYFLDNSEESFYLRSLKHIWDRSGTRTELDFIR